MGMVDLLSRYASCVNGDYTLLGQVAERYGLLMHMHQHVVCIMFEHVVQHVCFIVPDIFCIVSQRFGQVLFLIAI